ncbi:ABC transporter ATP-binding protein, partial [Chloroflexota bacterium]
RSYKGDLEGSVELYGQETAGMPLPRISQIVGTVLQDPERQILGSRVEAEVAFGLENLGLPRAEIEERIEETLTLLALQHLRGRETFYLSGGEKQKVAIAGTLAMRPSILLLDEPLASLDPVSAREALRLVRELADRGITVLLIEHRVEDVLSIGPDKALALVDGEQRYFGPLADFARSVSYHQVKLPTDWVMAEVQRELDAGEPAPTFPQPVLSSAEGPALQYPDEPGPPLIAFEQVSFRYEDGPLVLKDVNLDVRRGDIIAVLGPNGAGKTTLMKQAIGLLKPVDGRVLVQGQDTRQLSVAQIAHVLGYVFQSPSHMLFAPTVQEELAFGPRNLGHDEAIIEERASRAVTILNLDGLEDYPPLALSFGQQKRVSIGAVLAMGSRILAMDEPTAGQDYQNYMAFMESILQLPHFDAILFITHDVDLAICYANRVWIVDGGKIAANGPPEEVLADQKLLARSRLVPTSLLEANLRWLPRTGGFMRAEELALTVAGGEASAGLE